MCAAEIKSMQSQSGLGDSIAVASTGMATHFDGIDGAAPLSTSLAAKERPGVSDAVSPPRTATPTQPVP